MKPGPLLDPYPHNRTVYEASEEEHQRLQRHVYEANMYQESLAQGFKRFPWNRPPSGKKRGGK